MKISPAGINLIKEFEGCKLTAYPDPGTGGEPWTIGFGHTSMAGPPKVFKGLRITQQEADYILAKDLVKYEAAVERLVTVKLSQNQNDALVSFAFNCGIGNLERSTLLKKVNAKCFDEVPAEFMKWTKAGGKELKGLVRRRRAEAALWRGVSDNSPPDEASEARALPDRPKPKKTMATSIEGNAAIIIGAGSAATAIREAKPVIEDASDAFTAATAAFGTPAVLVFVGFAILAAVIWWRRKQRNDEDGA
jgi:lysozyme